MLGKMKKGISVFTLYAFWVLVLSTCCASISGCSTGFDEATEPNNVIIISPTPETMPNLPLTPEPSITPTEFPDDRYSNKDIYSNPDLDFQQLLNMQCEALGFKNIYDKYLKFIAIDNNGMFVLTKSKRYLLSLGYPSEEIDCLISMISSANTGKLTLDNNEISRTTELNTKSTSSKNQKYYYKNGWYPMCFYFLGQTLEYAIKVNYWGIQMYFPDESIVALETALAVGTAIPTATVGFLSALLIGFNAITGGELLLFTSPFWLTGASLMLGFLYFNSTYHKGVVYNISFNPLQPLLPGFMWFTEISDISSIADVTTSGYVLGATTDANTINPIPDPTIPTISPINTITPSPTPNPTPPPPEPGVQDTLRATYAACDVDEFEGIKFYIHKGRNNRKMYLARCDKFGNWSQWVELPGETNDAPDLCIYRGIIVITHRGLSNGTIYVATMNIDLTNFSGWRNTGRSSKYAPILVSDKGNIALIHDGANNPKIYYNTDFNNWFNNSNWKETPRTTHARVGAAMYQGILWIVHLGYGETKIYIGNVVNNKWDYTQRDSRISPALAILKDKKVMGHQGLDGKNYIGDPYDPYNWPAAKENTSCQPAMCALQDNMIGYAFVNIYSMRFQTYITGTPKPPAPLAGVEETGRTTGVAWCFYEFISDRVKQLIAIHIGSNRDGQLYVGIRNSTGTWEKWNPPIPWAWTDKPASIVYFKGKFVIVYTDAVNNIWIGEMNIDKTGWTGWYSTGRSSTHGALLATDGNYLYLIHKGSTNNRIYYNSDYSNYFNNGNWKDSGRSSNLRFAADVYRGILYIAHVGENETRIYWGNVVDNKWYYSGRDTISGPAIKIINGVAWLGHRGLTDNKNYVVNTSTGACYILKERTQEQPFLGIHNGVLKYGYMYNDIMRIQNVQ